MVVIEITFFAFTQQIDLFLETFIICLFVKVNLGYVLNCVVRVLTQKEQNVIMALGRDCHHVAGVILVDHTLVDQRIHIDQPM